MRNTEKTWNGLGIIGIIRLGNFSAVQTRMWHLHASIRMNVVHSQSMTNLELSQELSC